MQRDYPGLTSLLLPIMLLLSACATEPNRTVAAPEFDLASGVYSEAQEVEITCSTENAAIYFTLDGSEPDETATLYTEAVSIDTSTTLNARAYRNNWDPSTVATAVYAITDVATPIFNPVAGNYTTVQNVEIRCATPDVVIHFTRDGSEPTESDSLYTVAVYIDTTTTLMAKAFRTGMTSSGTATALFTIDFPDVAAPTIAPVAATYTEDQEVTISCATAGAAIRYTTDGSDPTEASTLYSAPFTVSVTTTVKARAWKEFMDPSPVTGNALVIDYPDVAAPVFDPVSATYTTDQVVTISCATADASIYYTLDNSDPTEASTPYTTGFTISNPVNIKARAYKAAMDPSPITTIYYDINYPDVAEPVATVPGGVYVSAVTVGVSCATAGATMHYTTNGVTPTESDLEWTSSQVYGTTTTLKVRAFAPDMDPSPVLTETYAIIPGLVAHYPFDGNANDASGNGHNGLPLGGVTSGSNRYNQAGTAYLFDGVDGQIQLADESAFDLGTFTISFWMRVTDLPLSEGPFTADRGEWWLVTKGPTWGNFRVGLERYGGASNGLIVYRHTNGGGTSLNTYNFSSSTAVYANPWYHVTVTVDTQVKIYFNGVLELTEDNPDGPPATNNNAVLIGNAIDADSDGSDYFKGLLDEVRFYSRALSAAEVSQLYSSGG